jgi:hypothetical protein
MKYLGVTFDKKKNTRRIQAETTAAKAIRTFISIYSVLKSKRLSVSAK